MQTFLEQTVFSVGPEIYTWQDVVLAAKFRGDWARLERELRQGLACTRQMDETEQFLTEEELDAAVQEFRYARGLITAQETEAWLERRGLSFEAWLDFLQRLLLVRRWSNTLEEILARYPTTEEEVELCIEAEGLCSGRLAEFAQQLAGQAAASAKLRSEAPAEPSRAEPGRSEEDSRLQRLGRDFERFREKVLVPRAIEAQVGLRHLDWIRFECDCVMFSSEPAAREAILCVREDGRELEEVAAEARAELRRKSFSLEELEPALRSHFLAAPAGGLIGPLGAGRGWALYQVLDKVLPSVQIPEIRRRAEQVVLKNAVEIEVNNRVQWHWRP